MVISIFVQGLARAFLFDHNELNSISLFLALFASLSLPFSPSLPPSFPLSPFLSPSLSLPLLSGGVKCGSYIGRMDQQEPNSGNYNQVRAEAKCGPRA